MNERLCLVCGDHGHGFNFSVMSCESCRLFFRRNGLKYEELRCYFGGKCDISVSSRKSCKKCRLRKCIDVGMKNKYTVNSDELKAFDSSIESSNDKLILRRQYHSSANQSEERVEELKQIETKVSDPSVVIDTNVSLNDGHQMSKDSELALMSIARPLTEFSAYISAVEAHQLTELWSAAQTLKYHTPAYSYVAFDVFDAFQLMGTYSERQIKNIVKLSKNLSQFYNFCEMDQLNLIKYSCVDIMIMRLVNVFDRNRECLFMPTDDNTVVVDLKLLKYKEFDLYRPKNRLLQHMSEESALDETVLDLLTVIILFNPNLPILIDKDMAKVQQQKYMRLLHRYLLLRYKSDFEAKTKFQRLINTTIAVNKLHVVNYKEFCAALGPHASALLNEVCAQHNSKVIMDQL